MPLLTLAEIEHKAQLGKLFKPFQLKSPMTITSSDLMWTLSLFKDEQQMIDFIVCLSENRDVCIRVNRKTIQQGCAANFLHAYTEHGLYPTELDKNRQAAIIAHFSKYTFKKAQLNYLLKNMPESSIDDFLLVAKCFNDHDLLQICNDLATIEKLSITTIKSLYHYYNPIRCWQESKTPYLDMHYLAYRAGHVLGLSKPISVLMNKRLHHFETEYAQTEVSLKIFLELLSAYADSKGSAIFEEIAKAVRRNWQLYIKNSSTYVWTAATEIYKQYRNHKLTFICTGWPGHDVTVVLYGNYLIYTNRGSHGNPRYGSRIFLIENPKLITKEWINRLIQQRSPKHFKNALDEMIHYKNPVVRFFSRSQKYNNCTLVNPKSSVEPIIVLMQAGPDANVQTVRRIAYQERLRKKYKHFTNFIRDREVDEMVKNMFYATHPHLITFYANLIKEIIDVHHGQRNRTLKDKQERTRAIDLFARTPDKIQKLIREDDEWMKMFKELCTEEGTSLAAPGMLLTYNHRVLNRSAHRSHNVVTEQGYIIEIDGVATPKMPFNFRNTRKLCTQVLKSW